MLIVRVYSRGLEKGKGVITLQLLAYWLIEGQPSEIESSVFLSVLSPRSLSELCSAVKNRFKYTYRGDAENAVEAQRISI
jgi:hypothetical protein